ncbi:MFS transporter [Siculibacillus lacustris]|uniref:MFS transporter n=1 Tax=Siculibacillus lacustris TaxID=1549641 RepID=UPI0013F16F99|nr:MFS transporter [Siculibacillus lacustris]
MPTLVVLVFGYLLSQFYRSFLAVIAPELALDVGLDGRGLGLVSAAFFGAFAAVQLPVGVALDRFGARRTVALPMLSAVVGAVLFSQAHAPATSIAAMVLIGLGCSPIYMGALWVIGRTTSPARFALWSSAIVGVGSLGNLAGSTPLAAAAAAWGWRATMLGIAGATLLSALAVAVVVRDPPPLATRGDADAPTGIGAVLAIRELWPLFPIALLSYPIVLAVRGLWIGPYFAQVHGLAPVERGTAVSVMVVAMIAGAFAYGPLDRWFGTRKWVVVGGTLATIAGLAALALAPRMPVVAASLAFGVVGGFGLTYGVLMAHARAFLPPALLGRGLTLMNMALVGGAALIQPASGLFVDRLTAGGLSIAEAHGALYGAFALALGAALAVYLGSRDARPG